MCINRPHSWKESNTLRAWRSIKEDQLSGISGGAECKEKGWSKGEWKTGSHRSLFHSTYSRIINDKAWKEHGWQYLNHHLVDLVMHQSSKLHTMLNSNWCLLVYDQASAITLASKLAINFWDDKKDSYGELSGSNHFLQHELVKVWTVLIYNMAGRSQKFQGVIIDFHWLLSDRPLVSKCCRRKYQGWASYLKEWMCLTGSLARGSGALWASVKRQREGL